MDAVFVFGDRIALDQDGRLYTGTSFSQEVFDRYLNCFDRLTLLMRKSPIDPLDRTAFAGLNPLTSDRIDVVFLPDTVASVKDFVDLRIRSEIRSILEEQIVRQKAVILRLQSYYSFEAARICVKRRIPYLAEAVVCPWDSLMHHSLKGRILAPFEAAQMRYSMKNASYAIYVTKHFLQKRYPTNGISTAISDVELLPSDEAVLKNRLKKISALKSQSRTLRIRTAGSVQVAYKGQRFVFKALARLKKEGSCSYQYHLAGGGDNSALSKLARHLDIEDLIVFEGMMSHEKMFEWLDSLDLYLQPSQVEGLSRALVEAMSRGLPAFASDAGGNPELLDPECIHKRESVSEIAEELTRLTPEKMYQMARRNYREAGKYQKEFLSEKRRRFLEEFAICAGGR